MTFLENILEVDPSQRYTIDDMKADSWVNEGH